MNNFKFKHKILSEGVKAPHRKDVFTQEEAAEYFGVETSDVIYSDGVVKGKGVWINDETSEAVFAKEKPKQKLGGYARKRL